MASKTEIANMAVSHIGASIDIANLQTEKSEAAAACRRFYQPALKEALRDFPWPFATKIDALALIEEDPNDEWAYSYRYPSDCMFFRRVLSGVRNDTRQTRSPHKIAQDDQGWVLYSDREDAQGEYTVYVNDPSRYPPDFIMAFSLLLASYIAPRIAGGDPFKMGERALRIYAYSIGKARSNSVNEQQDEEPPQSEFINARS